MSTRQVAASGEAPVPDEGRRAAQRRRTRAAIVAATSRLIAAGQTPSIDEIAAAADVSRRTVYMYFPTLDQLLLDATVGALSAETFETFTSEGDPQDPVARVDALVRNLTRTAPTTLPLGRKIIALTVDAPDPADRGAGPRRGYRRLNWIRHAAEPLRATLTTEQFDRLVAGLSVIVGWEAMVVLRDVGGLRPKREEEVLRWAARALVESILAESPPSGRTTAR